MNAFLDIVHVSGLQGSVLAVIAEREELPCDIVEMGIRPQCADYGCDNTVTGVITEAGPLV